MIKLNPTASPCVLSGGRLEFAEADLGAEQPADECGEIGTRGAWGAEHQEKPQEDECEQSEACRGS